jgi:hypothetical protein
MTLNFEKANEYLKQYLEEINYRFIFDTYKLDLDRPFGDIQGVLKVVNPFHAFVISLFRLNHKVEKKFINLYLQERVKDAMKSLGILEEENGVYRLRDLILIVRDDLYFLTKLPNGYPSNEYPVNLPKTTPFVKQSILPSSLKGKSVLEIFSDGFLGLKCATRGASHVYIFGVKEQDQQTLWINIYLNDQDTTVKILKTTGTEEIDKEFDVILSAPSTLPGLWVNKVSDAVEGGLDGLNKIKTLLGIIKSLKIHESTQIIMFGVFLGRHGDIFFNETQLKEFLSEMKLNAKALIANKMTLINHVDQYIESIKTDWEKIAGYDLTQISDYLVKWIENLSESKIPQDFVYHQIITISSKQNSNREPIEYLPFYLPAITDPLFNISFFSQFKLLIK